jgi:hypothetical protein
MTTMTLSKPSNSVVVAGNVNPFVDEPGRFCSFREADLISVIGESWMGKTGEGPKDLNAGIKDASGSVYRARNKRTGKEGGLLVWHMTMADSVKVQGCWNPTEFTTVNDWLPGDDVEFLDIFDNSVSLAPVKRFKAPKTGWGLNAENIQFGHCGLVGSYWEELTVDYVFEERSEVTAIWSDSIDLPYAVSYWGKEERGGAATWIKIVEDAVATYQLPNPTLTNRIRLHWPSTDLHKTKSLSSARSGGGLHAEVVVK